MILYFARSWERENSVARQFNWGGCLLNSNGGGHMIWNMRKQRHFNEIYSGLIYVPTSM